MIPDVTRKTIDSAIHGQLHSDHANATPPVIPASYDGYVVPGPERCALRRTVRLTGHVARRRPGRKEEIIWDDTLAGFGLRVQPSGTRSWIVKLTTRGKARKVTLGNTEDLPAHCARGRARALLAEAATDGLPKRRAERKAPSFAEHVEVFWADYARHWKPSTASSNRRLIDRELVPTFGPWP
jgi:hypothetical protein